LLSALLAQENGIVPGLLDKLSITASAVQLAVDRELERLPKVSGSIDTSKVYVTQSVNEVFTQAEARRSPSRMNLFPLSTCSSAARGRKPDALKKLPR